MNLILRIWYQGHKAYLLLLPLSWLYAVITAVRRLMYHLGIAKQHKLPVPVIVVGNISVGGTGKTPFTLLLCQLLQQQGWRPGIVSRGYGAAIKAPLLVSADATAAQVGDEPLLLARRSGCPVVVCPKRVAAAQHLLAQTDCNIIISDDGLQHYALARDIEIVLIDGVRGLGNNQLLPAGPLREGRWRARAVDLVVANSDSHPLADGVMRLQAGEPKALAGDARLQSKTVTLVAGIGNPQRFETTVLSEGYQITQRCFFVDHHQFSAEDFNGIVGPVLMTEKDAVKCKHFAKPDWFYLAVDAQLEQSVMTKLQTLITRLRSNHGH